MDIDPEQFTKYTMGISNILIKSNFSTYFGHKNRYFLYSKNILNFLEENPELNIYFTLDSNVENFLKVQDGFLINMDSYRSFCKTIQNRTTGRAKAYLGQNLSLKQINFTETEKSEFIQKNTTEEDIVDLFKSFDDKKRERLGNKVKLFLEKPNDQTEFDLNHSSAKGIFSNHNSTNKEVVISN
jgi:hypothetical protein